MARPVFEARIDQMRSLKNGKNRELLDVWVALIFDMPVQAVAADHGLFDELARHPYLPPDGVTTARMPTVAFRNPPALAAAVAAGFGAKHVKLPKGAPSVRAAAALENAVPVVHEMLDREGVAPLTLIDLNAVMPSVMKEAKYHTLKHVLAHHADAMRAAFHPPGESLLLATMLSTWARHAVQGQSRLWVDRMMQRLTAFGVDWDTVVAAHLEQHRSKSAVAQQALWLPILRADLARWRARYLEKTLQPAQVLHGASPPRRSRL